MKAIVLGGGGAKGAFQAGALKYLLGELEIKYDIICGISVGAINAGFLAQYKYGNEKQSAIDINNMWANLNTRLIYKRWFPFGKFHALWRTSLYNSSPLITLIKNNINLEKIRGSEKKISVGAVCLNSGKYTTFDQNDDFFIEAIAASSSFPGMLSPVLIRDHLFVDGGVKEHACIKSAIQMGAADIDLILTSPEIRNKHWIDYPNIGDVIQRSLELSTDKIMANDLEKAQFHNQLAAAKLTDKTIVKLNIIRPEYNLTEDILDFNPKKLKEMSEAGYIEAVKKYVI
jgi:NTE family protein